MAARDHRWDAVKFLVDVGVNVKTSAGRGALAAAVAGGRCIPPLQVHPRRALQR